MDPLSEVLALTQVRGTVAATLEAGGEWGVDIDHIPGAFHAVLGGVAWLELDDQPPRQLVPGDLVLLPNGPHHHLAAAPGLSCEPFAQVAARQPVTALGTLSLGYGDVRTRILCGSYREDATLNASLLGLLPSVIHLHADPSRPTDHLLHLMAHESTGSRADSATVLDRLLDVLLVHVIRAWLTTAAIQPLSPSWLTALRDPLVADALAALHGDVARNWTLADLAAQLTVSRATLARRFRTWVGHPPLAYLTSWRMEIAAHQLLSTCDPISRIAHSVGYTSEYAFNRAFSRVRGVTPGRFRSLGQDHQGAWAADQHS